MKALRNLNLNNVVFIDIETAPIVKELQLDTPLFDSWAYKKKKDNLDNEGLIASFSKEAGLHPEFAKILVISVGRILEDGTIAIKSYSSDNEVELLNEFNEDLNLVVSSNSKTQFCGHAAIGFDIPFIHKRMIVNQIRPCGILDNSGAKPWEVNILDTKDLWKVTSFYPTSLINIAVALGVPSPKGDIDGSQVGMVYWSGEKGALERITKYCENDVFATANILMRMMYKPLLTRAAVGVEAEVEEVSLIEALIMGVSSGSNNKGS